MPSAVALVALSGMYVKVLKTAPLVAPAAPKSKRDTFRLSAMYSGNRGPLLKRPAHHFATVSSDQQ